MHTNAETGLTRERHEQSYILKVTNRKQNIWEQPNRKQEKDYMHMQAEKEGMEDKTMKLKEREKSMLYICMYIIYKK